MIQDLFTSMSTTTNESLGAMAHKHNPDTGDGGVER
jgi:hypothetical protein